MSEFLDRVRADLDEATPWPWVVESGTHALYIESPIDDETCTPVGEVYGGSPVSETDACLIASTPDRLDRMERALRGALEAHDWTMRCGNVRHTRADAACDQCEAVCVACGERYPCPTVTTIREALSDE